MCIYVKFSFASLTLATFELIRNPILLFIYIILSTTTAAVVGSEF
jgi:hypothetical protein